MTPELTFTCAATAIWRVTNEQPKPDVSFVPPMERRRLTGVERAALSVAWQVRPQDEEEIPVVFASRWGEIGVTAKLMQQFHADGEMSPAGFSASVHNATPGAFSLLTKNHAPYTAIAARARSLEAGLLESFALRRSVLFVYAEEATPALYQGSFGEEETAHAVALRLVPAGEADAGTTWRVALRADDAVAPLRFEAFESFLTGRQEQVLSSSFTLTRG